MQSLGTRIFRRRTIDEVVIATLSNDKLIFSNANPRRLILWQTAQDKRTGYRRVVSSEDESVVCVCFDVVNDMVARELPVDARLKLKVKEGTEIDSLASVHSDSANFKVDAVVLRDHAR